MVAVVDSVGVVNGVDVVVANVDCVVEEVAPVVVSVGVGVEMMVDGTVPNPAFGRKSKKNLFFSNLRFRYHMEKSLSCLKQPTSIEPGYQPWNKSHESKTILIMSTYF